MIEIVLDQNEGNSFLDKERPVFVISQNIENTFPAYREKARDVIETYGEEQIIIIRNNAPSFSNNMFAVALFVESCLRPNRLECAVIKVTDHQQALQKYKPFVALTIGIKYVLRLCTEPEKVVYKEISDLGYLGLEIKNDYLNNKIFLTLAGTEEMKTFRAENMTEALILTGMLKSLALAQTTAAVTAEINITEHNPTPDKDLIVNRIVEAVTPWINDD